MIRLSINWVSDYSEYQIREELFLNDEFFFGLGIDIEGWWIGLGELEGKHSECETQITVEKVQMEELSSYVLLSCAIYQGFLYEAVRDICDELAVETFGETLDKELEIAWKEIERVDPKCSIEVKMRLSEAKELLFTKNN